MEVRKVVVSERILRPLEDLVRDFPSPSIRDFLKENKKPSAPSLEYNMKFTNYLHADLETYEYNQEIINAVIHEKCKFFSTDDIEIDLNSIVVTPVTILQVELDPKVEWLIDRGLELQRAYLEEVMKAGR